MSLFEVTENDRAAANRQPGAKFEPTPTHPQGEFEGKIKSTKVKSHATKGEYVLLVVETRAGTAFSSLYFNDATVAFTSPEDGPTTFAQLAKKELKRIMMSAYKADAALPTIKTIMDVATELQGLPVKIKVTHKPYNGKTYANVRFTKINDIDKISAKPKGADLKAAARLANESVDRDDELGF